MVSRRESRLSSSGAFPKVIIKSDFLEAIRLVSSQYDPNHPYIDIMHQIVVGASFHRHIVFSFAHREFNNVADWVENEALSFPLGNLVFSFLLSLQMLSPSVEVRCRGSEGLPPQPIEPGA